MNIRQVLKAFTALRQLTDDESALLETLRGATEAERELLVETLSPQKVGTKRAGKKSSKSGSKSQRASGMAAAISNSLSQQRRVAGDPELTGPTCAKDGCDWKEADLIHDPLGGYAGYHPFVSTVLPEAHEAGTGG